MSPSDSKRRRSGIDYVSRTSEFARTLIQSRIKRKRRAEDPPLPSLRRCAPRLLLLRPDPFEPLDLQRRLAALFGDRAVLLHDEAAGGLVAVEAAEEFRGDAAVGALGIVLIDDVEEGEFAFRVGSGFLGHGRLVVDCGAAVK